MKRIDTRLDDLEAAQRSKRVIVGWQDISDPAGRYIFEDKLWSQDELKREIDSRYPGDDVTILYVTYVEDWRNDA